MTEAQFATVGLVPSRLADGLRARALDGLVLASPANVFYTTGFPTTAGAGNPIMHALENQFPTFATVAADATTTLACWGVATFDVTYGADRVRPFFTREQAFEELGNAVDADLAGTRRVGIESDCPLSVVRLLEAHLPGVELVAADDLLAELRLVKTDAEIDRIRESTAIVERSVQDLVPLMHMGMSRLALLRAAKERLIANGADGIDHVTCAFGTANPEVALDETLEPDHLVTLDLGAVHRGYVSDNRRYAFTGTPPSELRELHAAMCRIVAEVGQALRPGATFADVHARATELHAAAGVTPMFLNAGHSLGIQVEERWLLAGDPTRIAEDMVFNIELYSFTSAGVMIGDEETFLVTADEPDQLSRLPTDIIEITAGA
ncbi:MAG: Xaa-Pro peptidase family protein [Acidimicrobiia bacterium]